MEGRCKVSVQNGGCHQTGLELTGLCLPLSAAKLALCKVLLSMQQKTANVGISQSHSQP